jgi:hypothetical protein
VPTITNFNMKPPVAARDESRIDLYDHYGATNRRLASAWSFFMMWQKQHAFNLTWCSRCQAGDDGCWDAELKRLKHAAKARRVDFGVAQEQQISPGPASIQRRSTWEFARLSNCGSHRWRARSSAH